MPEGQLFSWGNAEEIAQAMMMTRKPALLSPLSHLNKHSQVVLMSERTPQAFLMSAWITELLIRKREIYCSFDEDVVDELDEPTAMVLVGDVLSHDEMEEHGLDGWQLHLVPTHLSWDVMKIFQRTLNPARHPCEVPWGRLILPRRRVPATYHMTLTGHDGHDFLMERSGAVKHDQPIARRIARRWIRQILYTEAESMLWLLTFDRICKSDRLAIASAFESVRVGLG